MAYTPPTMDASSQTWANLQARGFHGYVYSYLAALTTQTPTANASQATKQLLHMNQAFRPVERAKNIVDNYINGKSSKTAAKTDIFDLQLAVGCLYTALGEIGVLVDAN